MEDCTLLWRKFRWLVSVGYLLGLRKSAGRGEGAAWRGDEPRVETHKHQAARKA